MAGSVANIAASRKVVEKSIAPSRNEVRERESFPKLLDDARSKSEAPAEHKNTAPTKRSRKTENTQDQTEINEQDVAVDESAEATDVQKAENSEEAEPVAEQNAGEVEGPVVDEEPTDREIAEITTTQADLPLIAMVEAKSPLTPPDKTPEAVEADSEKPTVTRIAAPSIAKAASENHQLPASATAATQNEIAVAKSDMPSDVKVTLPGELAPEPFQDDAAQEQPSNGLPQPTVKSSQSGTESVERTDEEPEVPAQLTATTATPVTAPQQQQHQFADTMPTGAATEGMPVGDKAPSTTPSPAPVSVPQPPPETRFAESNHPKIISSVQGTLLPRGGTMQIRLDPPELGALNVIVKMHDGLMTAQFQTSNEEATKLLSHSLNLLKHSLESQGVTIDKLQVQQAPRDMRQDASTSDQQRDPQQQQQQNDEQQRREMLRRMWRRLANGSDPLDLVA